MFPGMATRPTSAASLWWHASLALMVASLAGLSACPDAQPDDYFRVPTVQEPKAADAGVAPQPIAPADVLEPPGPADVHSSEPDAPAPTPQVVEQDPSTVPSFVGLFQRLSPSVVNIYTQEVVRERLFDPMHPLNPFLEEGGSRVGTSLGSGTVLDIEGHILTNAHVVENAAEIRVRFHDESELPARLVGIDPVRDLALIKVDGAEDLRPVAAGEVPPEVGEWIIAIGNPFGLSHTLTKGIISGKGRSEFITPDMGYLDLIQTDAAINGGNSGGPIFNLRGEVVGIATAVSAEGQGISFAIPWRVVEAALPRLMQGGQVSRSWLGVYIRQAEQGGVLVVGVVDDSPAQRSGIHPGDRVLRLDGREVESVPEFRLQVAAGVAGRDTALEVIRGGRVVPLTVQLEEARDVR